MQSDIDAYFATRSDEKPPTISGLAYALDMSTESLRRYGEDDPFCAIVRKAKQRVEIALEDKLNAAACTGAIFNLKCNFRWVDKSAVELSGPDGGPFVVQAIERTIVQPDN